MRRSIVLTVAAVIAAGCVAGTASAPAAVGGPTSDGTRVGAVVPAIRMDTTALRVATAPGGSTLTGLGTIPLRVRPVSVVLTPRGALTPTGLADVLDAAGVEILWGQGDCDAVRWSVPAGGFDRTHTGRPATEGTAADTVPAGEARRLCTRLKPDGDLDEFVQRFAGRRMLATTRWTSESQPPATWSSTASTNAVLTVPLPSPDVAAAKPCTPARGGVTVRWTWPSATSTPVSGADGIDRWTVEARPAGSGAGWVRVGQSSSGTAREVHVKGAALRAAKLPAGKVDLMVRAHPFPDDETVHADSSRLWTVAVPARGAAACAGTTANDGRLVEMGSDG